MLCRAENLLRRPAQAALYTTHGAARRRRQHIIIAWKIGRLRTLQAQTVRWSINFLIGLIPQPTRSFSRREKVARSAG
jgi:hypothetical protein